MGVRSANVRLRHRRRVSDDAAPKLDASAVGSKNGRPSVVLIEYPDPEGRRWQTALELLLEAGGKARKTGGKAREAGGVK